MIKIGRGRKVKVHRVTWKDKLSGKKRSSQWYSTKKSAEANLQLKKANKRMYPKAKIESKKVKP